MKVYVYNDGTHSPYMPVFTERNEWLREARECVKNIGKNLKKRKNEFIEDVWMYDSNVIKYRELMRKIWTYQPTQWVVDEIESCDKCHIEQNNAELYSVEYDWFWEKFIYHHSGVVCKKCLEHEEWKIETLRYENVIVKKL